jgi:uncharacterized protein
MSDEYRYSERQSGRARNGDRRGEWQAARRDDDRGDDLRDGPRRRRGLSDLFHPTEDEKNSAMLCHLLAIFLHFVGPIIIWASKKDESKFVDWHGREALNFSINMLIYNLVGAAVFTLIAIVTCGFGALLFPLMLIVPIYSLIMHIVALNSAKRGEIYRYPMIFRIIGPPEGAENVADGVQPREAAYETSTAYADGGTSDEYPGSAPASGGSSLWIWITAAFCLLLLFGCFGGIGLFFLLKGSSPATTKIAPPIAGDAGGWPRDLPREVPIQRPNGGGDQQPGAGQAIPPGGNNPPKKADPVEQALDDMKDADRFVRGRAADALARLQPNHAKRSEVAGALEKMLQDAEDYPRQAAVRALAVWGTKEQVATLLELLKTASLPDKNKIIVLLGEFRDERAIKPLAELLKEASSRRAAADALKNFGSKAEDDVIPMLRDARFPTKQSACEVLKVIGTKKSIAPLEEATKDKSPATVRSAKEALEAVKARNQ